VIFIRLPLVVGCSSSQICSSVLLSIFFAWIEKVSCRLFKRTP
jgi:hypothetical protein